MKGYLSERCEAVPIGSANLPIGSRWRRLHDNDLMCAALVTMDHICTGTG
jgi:hypothetical protein